ncbi:putative UDP-N-acetylglucosamine 2-epimerase [Peptoniphilus sp. ING2-D1G]|nr:putative UDP-N-acetylglucosamine 2-epimerase [Peptoniphilus sp. ING2-D1G]
MKVICVFGTRPEAIKMAPIVKELKRRKHIDTVVAVTAQHREMLDQVLKIFDIEPDYDMNIFKSGQSLTDITVGAIKGLEEILDEEKPDVLLIQGDTTTVFASSVAAFYKKIKIGHVEAGLRSDNLYSPYPEEANRRLTSVLTNFHFAPTKSNKDNLIREGYDEKTIYITGNTVIDALKYAVSQNYEFEDDILNKIDYENKKVVLLTSHRRENIGEPMNNIFSAVRDVVKEYDDVEVVFPIHLNPKVREIAKKVFGKNDKIHIIEPLDYLPFSNLMSKVYLVITDSGGIQEEAPALGKPVIVVREETERMEGVLANTAALVGSDYNRVYKNFKELLDDTEKYKKMAHAINPYGDGHAAGKIIDILEKELKN